MYALTPTTRGGFVLLLALSSCWVPSLRAMQLHQQSPSAEPVSYTVPSIMSKRDSRWRTHCLSNAISWGPLVRRG